MHSACALQQIVYLWKVMHDALNSQPATETASPVQDEVEIEDALALRNVVL